MKRQKASGFHEGRNFLRIIAASSASIFIICAFALLLIPIVCASSEGQRGREQANENDSVFRLHIIANSDSEFDQSVKLAVRDAVLEFERGETVAAEAKNADDSRHIIMNNSDKLLKNIERTLRDYGVDYGAQLMIGRFDFPDRSYGGKVYPAGEYTALRVLLGEAEGKNWWCVMFPPLCIVEADTGEIESEEKIEFDSLFVKLWRYLFGGS